LQSDLLSDGVAGRKPSSPEINIHPAAAVFPRMTASALQELADSIRASGLCFAITRDKDGLILDGRNRLEACEIAGVAPRFETYTGNDPVGFIISANLKRRHLNESQRALIAPKLAALTHGGDRRSDQAANLLVEIPKQSVAAKLLNVSERSVRHAAVVRKHGTPELISKVEAGDLSVSAAAKQAQPPKPKTKPKQKRRTSIEIQLKRLLERFRSAIGKLTDASLDLTEIFDTPDIPVPPLSDADAADAIERIEAVENDLRILKARIKAGKRQEVAADIAQALTPSDDLAIPSFLKRTKASHDA
jgi:hypothetical protein